MQAKLEMFQNRLAKVERHLRKQANRQGVTCYRLYDHDVPEFPMCIDRYENHLYVAEYKRRHGLDEELHARWLQDSIQVMSETLQIPLDQIHYKVRQRKPGRQGQYQKQETDNSHFFTVTENGLRFLVNLDEYLDTGLFLDHRDTRKMVRECSQGKSVLNLFAYTGSFSVYAAAGGASHTTTIDLSNTYIDWAKKNMALNGFTGSSHSFIAADVLQLLPKLEANSYDLIVMDPPTFSNSKKMDEVLDIQRDHVRLINQCMRLLKQKGMLIFSTNLTSFVFDSSLSKQYNCKDITSATTPFDFQGKLKRFCFRIEA
jgi:23S rRNA (cytosine1962-C5)-methyltransferase